MKLILKYGLIYAALLILLDLANCYLFNYGIPYLINFVLGVLIPLVVLYLLGIEIKRKYAGNIFFGDCFLRLLLAAVIGSFLSMILFMIHLNYINPEIKINWMEYNLLNAGQSLFGISEEQAIDAQTKILQSYRGNGLINNDLLNSTIGGIFLSMLNSFIVSLVLSYKKILKWHKIA